MASPAVVQRHFAQIHTYLRQRKEARRQAEQERTEQAVLNRIKERTENPPVFEKHEQTYHFSHNFRSIPAAVKLALDDANRKNSPLNAWVIGIGEKAHSEEGRKALPEHERIAEQIEKLSPGTNYTLFVSEYHPGIAKSARERLPPKYGGKINFITGDASLHSPVKKVSLVFALDAGRNPEDTEFAMPLADRIYEALEEGGIAIANGQALQACLTSKGLVAFRSQIEQSEGHGSIVYFFRKLP